VSESGKIRKSSGEDGRRKGIGREVVVGTGVGGVVSGVGVGVGEVIAIFGTSTEECISGLSV
jgi:hypothetical protein